VEAFESFVALALEAEQLVVSEAVKLPVTRPVAKAARREIQTHGYEVDLVGARADRLVLATVKSFFGSRGVASEDVTGQTTNKAARGLYRLLNEQDVRSAVIRAAAQRFGYQPGQVYLRLYVGRFAGPKQGHHERRIREWCAGQIAGAGPIEVFGVEDVVSNVRAAAAHRQYRDNAVLVTMKVLEAADLLPLKLPDDVG
jgi:hypothetical protein